MPLENPRKYVNVKNNMHIIHWLISEKCNENCKFCYANFGNKFISLKEAKRIVDLLRKEGFDTIKFTGGEPLLYPHIKKILSYCKSKKIRTELHTNGLLISNSFLKNIKKYVDELSLSLDGSNEEIQTKVTRLKVHYSKNIEILKKLKKPNIEISLKTLVCKINQEDIIALGMILSNFKIKSWVLFEFRPLGKGKMNRKMFEISHNKYEFIKKEVIKKFTKKFKLIFISKEIGHSPYVFINSSGDIFTIHPNLEKDVFIGNLLKQDVREIIKKIKKIHKFF